MKILMCHNYYQRPGGEDCVFADESNLLESNGHDVIRYTQHNSKIEHMSRWSAARQAIWSRESYEEISQLIAATQPAVIHFANTFPLISPAAYHAAQRAGVAVVQTLHNYRLACVNAFFLRDGRPCEKCVGKYISWPGVLYGCYRDSRAASAVVAAMQFVHRVKGTWTKSVDRYIALTEFARSKFVEAGLPAGRIVVKPNFVAPDPGAGAGAGDYALFVGRLSEEKGIRTLLAAWEHLTCPLKIIGDGPLADQVDRLANQHAHVEWMGARSSEEVLEIMGNARVLVFPSIWYEGLPKTIIEAFSRGTPVIASRLGSMTELIDDGVTGLHVDPNNPQDLSATIAGLRDTRLREMRTNARLAYEERYTAELNYLALMDIYRQALEAKHAQQIEQVADEQISSTPMTVIRQVAT